MPKLNSAYNRRMKSQLELDLQKGRWGGWRKNAGRKAKKSPGVGHVRREKISKRTPVHINFRLNQKVRTEKGLEALKAAISNSQKFFSVIHYSVQSNHIHLILEAENNQLLTKGMRSFAVTFAKHLGKGSIQKERYHLHVLKGKRETQNAFRYVIFNEVHHSKKRTIRADLFSSLHRLNLKELSVEYKINITKINLKEKIEIDQPASWLAKQGLNPT